MLLFRVTKGAAAACSIQTFAERIRAIFLHEQPHVTIDEAARLLGWSRTEMNRAIRDGEIELDDDLQRGEVRLSATWRIRPSNSGHSRSSRRR